MKRRDFIKTSLLAAGSAVIFTGCTKNEPESTDINNNEDEKQTSSEINCTACQKCKEVCPIGINIPATFSIYKNYKNTGDKTAFLESYNDLNENERPDKCIKCRVCVSSCPQNIDIPEKLEKIAEEYKTINS